MEKTASFARFIAGLVLAAVVAAGLAPDAFVPQAHAQAAGKHASPKGKKEAVGSEDRAIQRLERAKRRVERLRKKVRKAEEAFLNAEPGAIDAAIAAEQKAWHELYAAEKEIKKAKQATLGGQVEAQERRLKEEWQSANDMALKACKQLDRCSESGLGLLKAFLTVHVSRIEEMRKSLKALEKRLWKWRRDRARSDGAAGKRREETLRKIDRDLRVTMERVAKQAAQRLAKNGRSGKKTDTEKAKAFSLIDWEFKIFGVRDKAEIERYKLWKRLQLRMMILDALAAQREAKLKRFIRKVEAKMGEKKDAKDKNGNLRSFVPHIPAIHPAPNPGMTPPMEPRFPAAPPEPMGPR